MQYETSPYSPLNMARTIYAQDKAMLGRANAGKSTVTRAQAMGLLNKSRAKLRQIATGRKPVPRDTPDFETTVAGIPCGVVVTHLDGGCEARLFGPPEDCSPGEPPEVEFHLVDRKGYYAAWLEAKMTDDDATRIQEEALSNAV